MDINQIYTAIQAQEVNFPVPTTTEVLTIGTAKIGYQNPNVRWPYIEPFFVYGVPTWNDTTGLTLYHQVGVDEFTHRPINLISFLPNLGADITVCNIKNLNIRIELDATAQWRGGAGFSFVVTLGSQTQTLPSSATEVIFQNVTDTNPTLAITAMGSIYDPPGIPPTTNGVGEILPLKIDWQIIGAGAMTIPVLPTSLVYAPIVDAQKKNQASSATSNTAGNTSSFSISRQDSTQVPIPSVFQQTADVKNAMAGLGTILSYIPIPVVALIGKALTAIASGLGSTTATQTDTLQVTQQNTLSVSDTLQTVRTAPASEGGPGVGDLIIYYRDVKVVWFFNNGQMQLAVLGHSAAVSTSVNQLQLALKSLHGKPEGTLDAQWALTAESITALLSIDPFVAGGEATSLPSSRFVLVSDGVLEIGAGETDVSYTHTVSSTELSAQSKITAQSETDSPGFLSFLGLGITQQKTVSWQINQTSSTQSSTSNTFTNSYKLFGNGNEHYALEVYFDVVFGVYAFRSVPINSQSPVISGSVRYESGAVIPHSEVTVSSLGKRYVSRTDASGKYKMRLPGIAPGDLVIFSGTTALQVNYDGRPLGVNITIPSA
jgi:hypothetical protein